MRSHCIWPVEKIYDPGELTDGGISGSYRLWAGGVCGEEIPLYWPHLAHRVRAYLIKDGPVRFSDDGEPGGTAGMPTLQVLQREHLFNVTCVVTRYFGGILLGAGGLVRAYARGAKIAVDAAGKSMKRIWTALYLPVPYSWYERMKLEVAAFGGLIRDTQFGADVELEVLLPEAQAAPFLERLRDLSGATLEALITGQEYWAFPLAETSAIP